MPLVAHGKNPPGFQIRSFGDDGEHFSDEVLRAKTRRVPGLCASMVQNRIAIVPQSMEETRRVKGVGRHRFEVAAGGRTLARLFS